jgi:hypothetical protein
MLNDIAVTAVIAAATALGVGGAAWLLMFRPVQPLAPVEVRADIRRSERAPSIDWRRGA